jgi:hypothetical protein
LIEAVLQGNLFGLGIKLREFGFIVIRNAMMEFEVGGFEGSGS